MTFAEFNDSKIYDGYGTPLRFKDQIISAFQYGKFEPFIGEFELDVDKEIFILNLLKRGVPIYVMKNLESQDKESSRYAEYSIIEASGTEITFNKRPGTCPEGFDPGIAQSYGTALILQSYFNREKAVAFHSADIEKNELPGVCPSWMSNLLKILSNEELELLPDLPYFFTCVNQFGKHTTLIKHSNMDVQQMLDDLSKRREKTRYEEAKKVPEFLESEAL